MGGYLGSRYLRASALLSIAGLLFLFSQTVFAWQPEPLQPRPVTVPAGDVELARLVDLAAERLGLNIEYDKSVLRGSVTLRLGAPLDDAQLWALVNRSLASRGFTTVRAGPMLSVVRLADAAGLAAWDGPDAPAAGYATVLVRVEHRPVRDVLGAVEPLLSRPGGRATVLGEAGLLAVSDLAPRLEQLLELIGRMDVPGSAVAVEEVPAQNLAASQLTVLVAQVAAKREAVSGAKVPGDVLASPDGRSVLVIAPEDRLGHWRGLIGQLDQREGVRTRTYTPRYFPVQEVAALVEQVVGGRDPAGVAGGVEVADDRWRLVVDELTGSLIATATPTQHGLIEELMERLDGVPAEARRPMRRFVVRHRSVEEVLSIVRNLMDAGVLDLGDTPTPTTPTTPAGEPIEPTGPRWMPWPPPRDSSRDQPGTTNGRGTPPGETDETPPANSRGMDPGGEPAPARSGGQPSRRGMAGGSVPLLLTADEGTSTIIAIGEPRLLAQLESLIESLDVRQPQVMLEVVMVSLSESQSLDLAVELEKLVDLPGDTTLKLTSLFGVGRASPTSIGDGSGGAGLTGVVLSPGDFAAVVRALETVNRGRSLSRPRLLVTNNQAATFDSVSEEPFLSVNVADVVATTSFGGFETAGTQVTVRPRIARGDHLELEYSVSLSAFVGESAAPGVPPPRQRSRVNSVAAVPDGHTVVVGGIETTAEGYGETRIPILGQFPLIGELFKSRSRSSSRARFFVFIRADVMRGPGFEYLRHVSGPSLSGAGVGDGWPVVEPRVIR